MSRRDSDDEKPLVLPTTAYPPGSPTSRPSHRRPVFTSARRRIAIYIGAFLFTIVVLHQIARRQWPAAPSYWDGPSGAPSEHDDYEGVHGGGGGTPNCGSVYIPTTEEPPEEWPLERVREMVAGTKGYYARDYSLWLGWNNIRYIIEAGLVQAELLNRTLIIPSFVYARGCEYELNACAAFLEMVNRGDAINWEEWRDWPLEKQMGWITPIDLMIDLPHLRETHAVVTIADYLRLRGLSPDLEKGNGQWDDGTYHAQARLIPNHAWDPTGVVRVDRLPPPFTSDPSDEAFQRAQRIADDVHSKVEKALGDAHFTDYEPIKQAMGSRVTDDAEMELALKIAGFEVLHTFEGSRSLDLIKSVHQSLRQIARRSELRGMVDDYGSYTDEVIRLQGEVHLYRKPGNLRFTTDAARQSFARMVLYSLQSRPEIVTLAERVDQRMRERTGGRMWMAAHMRRGDFVTYHWQQNGLEAHVQDVKDHLKKGPEAWRQIRSAGDAHTFDVPGVHLASELHEGEPPRTDDPFYVATDERDPDSLAYMRSQGAVLIMDLLRPEDRALVGWPLLITDILALVEQHVMSRAAFFYGYGASSVAGGVLNLRAAHGWDPRTTDVE